MEDNTSVLAVVRWESRYLLAQFDYEVVEASTPVAPWSKMVTTSGTEVVGHRMGSDIQIDDPCRWQGKSDALCIEVFCYGAQTPKSSSLSLQREYLARSVVVEHVE